MDITKENSHFGEEEKMAVKEGGNDRLKQRKFIPSIAPSVFAV